MMKNALAAASADRQFVFTKIESPLLGGDVMIARNVDTKNHILFSRAAANSFVRIYTQGFDA